MTVKLNLTMDEDTATAIKKYAKRKGTSVSKIAVELFERELKDETRKKEAMDFFNKWVGSANTGIGEDYEEELIKAIAEKHHG
jgi:Family of unknown function (DUF6364)